MRWLCGLLWCAGVAGAAPLVIEGALPDGGPDFVMIPFEVPAGTVELSVAHPVLQPENILDYGVFDPSGYRGWGGGNSEPAVIGVNAASRSYLSGPIGAGTWSVLIGKAKIITAPATYRLEIELRTTATLAPQPRATFVPTRLKEEARWYAGDFHVHSQQSGDAQPTMDAVASFAALRGLDFVEFSEHNTTAQLGFLNEVQARHPDVLLLPGVEFTTYAGHANGIGATRYVDHRLGYGDVTLDTALSGFAQQDVVLSINHPLLELGQSCIGCAWKHRVPREQLGAVEIGTGGFDKTGLLFGKQTLAWWERFSAQGLRFAPIGGSDDHSGGQGTGMFDSPIGSPTTMVFAQGLEPASIVAGVRAGHTVVKLQGPMDPMVELRVGEAMVGDEVSVSEATLAVTVTGGVGAKLVIFRDGAEFRVLDVDATPFVFTEALTEGGRFRAEAQLAGQPRTVTNNLWVTLTPPMKPSGCSSVGAGSFSLGLLLLLGRVSRRRRPMAPLSGGHHGHRRSHRGDGTSGEHARS